MNRLRMLLLAVLLISSFSCVFGQGDTQQNFGISFKGFVKLDAFFDSRQVVAAREGHLLLYPAEKIEDENGDDINASPSYNMLAIQTRLSGTITAPDAFGAKSSGYIEGEFFGHSDTDVNGFRLRHAFVKLDWTKTSLMFGQYWHPMFVTQSFPGVISFNTGMPMEAFSRNPQVRLTQKLGESLSLIVAAISQRDFFNSGPSGGTSKYLRDAVIPNLHAQIQATANKNLFGAGIDYKMLKPSLTNAAGLKSSEKVSSMAGLAYAKVNLSNVVWKLQGVYGQNMTDHIMLGGYLRNGISPSDSTEYDYIPTSNYAFWTELEGGTKTQLGLFLGYTENLGAADPIRANAVVYSRGFNIKSVMRAAPRVVWNQGKTRLALELEYTSAAYADTSKENAFDEKGKIQETYSVSNIRFLFAAYVFF